MSILGAHQSIAGGYDRAVTRAASVRCACVQLFTKNNNQWRAKPISPDQCVQFQTALRDHKIQHTASHTSYLINLASPDAALWKKSLDALVVEMQRAELLGIPYVVVHPGSYTTSSERRGLTKVVRALNEMHRQLPDLKAICLLETTAGQGTNLGWRFEHLADILQRVASNERVGICVDTCHIFAAGYRLEAESEYEATFAELDRLVGLKRVAAIHLNDSKAALGSRVDRHEHIGQGHIGRAVFRRLLQDSRFQNVPMYLETPKGMHNGTDWDAINLRTLRRLLK